MKTGITWSPPPITCFRKTAIQATSCRKNSWISKNWSSSLETNWLINSKPSWSKERLLEIIKIWKFQQWEKWWSTKSDNKARFRKEMMAPKMVKMGMILQEWRLSGSKVIFFLKFPKCGFWRILGDGVESKNRGNSNKDSSVSQAWRTNFNPYIRGVEPSQARTWDKTWSIDSTIKIHVLKIAKRSQNWATRG